MIVTRIVAAALGAGLLLAAPAQARPADLEAAGDALSAWAQRAYWVAAFCPGEAPSAALDAMQGVEPEIIGCEIDGAAAARLLLGLEAAVPLPAQNGLAELRAELEAAAGDDAELVAGLAAHDALLAEMADAQADWVASAEALSALSEGPADAEAWTRLAADPSRRDRAVALLEALSAMSQRVYEAGYAAQDQALRLCFDVAARWGVECQAVAAG